MAEPNALQGPPEAQNTLEHHLAYLQLSFLAAQ